MSTQVLLTSDVNIHVDINIDAPSTILILCPENIIFQSGIHCVNVVHNNVTPNNNQHYHQ